MSDINNNYDCIAKLFTFNEPGKTSHMAIDVPSFRSLIQSDGVQKDLREGKLLGLLSHEGRSRARASNLPHCDIVATDPDVLWVLKGVWEDNNSFYGGFNFLKHSKAAKKVKDLYKAGTKLYISISTELVIQDRKYIIKKLWGADLTLRPEFVSAEVLDGNFDFSEGKTIMVNLCFETSSDFSLKEYIKERQMYRPALFFRRRVQEVIRYIRFNRPEIIQQNREFLLRYISEYLLEWVQRAYRNPDDKFNLMFELKLTEYCKDFTPIRYLQIYLTRARAEVDSQGQITKPTQTKLNSSFNDVCDQIFDYINSKTKNPEKAI